MGDKIPPKRIKRSFFLYFISSFLCFLNLSASSSLNEESLAWPSIIAKVPSLEMEIIAGGATNKTYKYCSEERAYVIRMGTEHTKRLSINRRREIAFHQLGVSLNISPLIYYSETEKGILVTSFIQGVPLTKERLQDQLLLNQIVSSLKRLHDNKKNCSQGFGAYYLSTINSFLSVLNKEDDPYLQALLPAILEAKKKCQALPQEEILVASHNDFSARNLIEDNKGKVWVIDWEYSDWGCPYNDLASFIMEDRLSLEQEKFILKNYFDEEEYQLHENNFKLTCALYSLQSSAWALSQLYYEFDNIKAALLREAVSYHLQKFWELFKMFS